jgi:hypothetical protein
VGARSEPLCLRLPGAFSSSQQQFVGRVYLPAAVHTSPQPTDAYSWLLPPPPPTHPHTLPPHSLLYPTSAVRLVAAGRGQLLDWEAGQFVEAEDVLAVPLGPPLGLPLALLTWALCVALHAWVAQAQVHTAYVWDWFTFASGRNSTLSAV